MLKSLLKASAAIVDVPVAVAADVVTLGGALDGKDNTHTEQALDRLARNVSDITEPEG